MKLTAEEQTFVTNWKTDYISAIKAAKAYREYVINKPFVTSIAEVIKEINLYAEYKFYYGMMLGMLHVMRQIIRTDFYKPCNRALSNLMNEAYGRKNLHSVIEELEKEIDNE